MAQDREQVRRLMAAINRIDGIWYLLAKKSGVKVNTLSLLFALDDGLPHTQKQICEEWIIPRTTINTVVQECAQMGYLELRQRARLKEKELILTPKGMQYAKKVLAMYYQAENEAMRRTLEQYSPEFIDAVKQYADFLKEETK